MKRTWKGKRIETDHVDPAIPTRTRDWSANLEGQFETGPVGWGSTEERAVNNLIAQLEEQ